MGRKVASFSSLLLFLSTLPPSTLLQCKDPLPQPPRHLTPTHINTHSPPGPLKTTSMGEVGGSPQLFKQIPADGRGTFLLESHRALRPPPLLTGPDHVSSPQKPPSPPGPTPLWPPNNRPGLLPPVDPELSSIEGPAADRNMPSDFLTPFLELDEEFCKVRRTER